MTFRNGPLPLDLPHPASAHDNTGPCPLHSSLLRVRVLVLLYRLTATAQDLVSACTAVATVTRPAGSSRRVRFVKS